MKKILILSYFYPPANFAGGQRTSAMAKHFHEFGYYPIVVTRQWNEGQTDLTRNIKCNDLLVEHNTTHEVHRLPYKKGFCDRLSRSPLLKPIKNKLSKREWKFYTWNAKQFPFLEYSRNLLEDDAEIKIVIVSGAPFQAFSIGYQLKNEFPYIQWIPDYRTEWSTNKVETSNSFIGRKINKIEEENERKWTSNSSFFTTVSEAWKKNISDFIVVPGIVVSNGVDKELFTKTYNWVSNVNVLNLLYLGSVYPYQDFTKLIQTIVEMNDEPDLPKIHLTFLGSFTNESERKALEEKTKALIPNVTLKRRKSPEFIQDFIDKTDVLLLSEYIGLKGCLPVKIFDYYNSNKPMLLCSSDNDVMEKFIKETSSGYIANTQEECKSILESLLEKKKSGEPLIGPRNTENAETYTRKYQIEKLSRELGIMSYDKKNCVVL